MTKINSASYVCCGKSKSKFHRLRGKKCTFNEIKSIIKFLVNSNLDLNPLKRRNVFSRSNFWQTIKKNFYCSVYEVISQRKWPSSYKLLMFCPWQAQMTGPRAAAIRGLVIIFVHMCRKTLGQQMSRLTKQDEHGLSLLHHAAMNNRPQIIVSLLRQTVDINSRRNNILSTGNSVCSLLLQTKFFW